MRVAAGLFTIAAVSAQALLAQGGEKGNRAVGGASPAPRESAHLQPARGILRNLVGTWRYETWFAGNFDGAPDASGTRVVKALFDDLRVEWTEQLDHSEMQGQGIIGFDPGSGRFFSASVYSAGSAPEFTTGIVDDAEPRITFTPISLSPDASPGQQLMQSSALNVLDQNHFTWVALNRTWRAVFTRQQ